MRTAYEKGYKVITLTDCTAATSLEAQVISCKFRVWNYIWEHFLQEAAVKFTFPMFSVPMTHDQFVGKLWQLLRRDVSQIQGCYWSKGWYYPMRM